MKQSILWIAALALTLGACEKFDGDKPFIPKDVRQAFESDFPDAMDVSWDFDFGIYEVEFVQEGWEKEAVYNKDAMIQQLETEIAIDDLPGAIIEHIAETSDQLTIVEADKLEMYTRTSAVSDGNTVLNVETNYYVEIQDPEMNDMEMIFDEQGIFMDIVEELDHCPGEYDDDDD